MKTYTKALLMLALFLFGTAGLVSAQEDPVNVTFRVNTSTVADTLTADGVLQIRGAVNGEEFTDEGYFGQNINWGSTSVQAQNVEGDYWEFNLQMAPGDELSYKFWAGNTTEEGLGFNDGWEFNFDGEGDNYTFEVPEDATEDIVTDLQYFAGTSDGRQAPFEPSEEGEIAVFFRVNVGARVATSQFDPEDESQIVGLRGQVLNSEGEVPADDPLGGFGATLEFERETQPENANHLYSGTVYIDQAIDPAEIAYKFVIEDGEGNIQWEDGNDKIQAVPEEEDVTVQWQYFNGEVPPSGNVVTSEVEFRANVSLLESLGYFNRGIGDQVAVPGAFNGWDSSTPMNYNEAEDIWTSSFELTREAGSEIPFKYFIIWDESRFDETSENYIPNLVADNGWEEPGSFGGGDRLFTFEEAEQQVAEGDFGGDIGFFNSLPEQALITETGTGSATYPVTFQVDMTPALSFADQPFDPESDEIFLVVETPIFGLTQNLSVGDGQPGLDDPDQRDRLRFEATGEDNIYELTLELSLPTENHFGFNIAYEYEDSQYILTGGGFDAGRRYYRYVEPETVLDEFTIWPAGGYTLDMVEWKAEDLPFPEPPSYGLVTNIEDPRNGDVPVEIELSQNYPNPFNPTTNINFTIPEMSDVRLDVFNILGQRVATLVDGNMNAGAHTVQFDASNLSSGVYLYRLSTGNVTAQRTMMLVK